jgi:hypothetical protein
MKSRTTWLLIVLVLIVGGLVVFDHYKGTPTEEAETKRKRMLNFEAKDITGLEIVRPNQTIVLEKSGDHWEIKQPLAVRANYSAVSSVLDELEFAERKRTLTEKEIGSGGPAEFGLDAPRMRATLRGKKSTLTLLVGHETPARDAVYVQEQGKKEILVADKSVYERLDRRLDDFRDRVVLEFTPTSVTRMEIKNPERVIELARPPAAAAAEQRWTIIRPVAARADQRKVSELLAELNTLRVLDFVSDDPKDPRHSQIPESDREISIWSGSADLGKTLLVGAALTNEPTKVYAKRKGSDSIFTISTTAADKFTLQVNDLRDRHLLSFSESDLRGIELLRRSEKTQLARSAAGWEITAPTSVAADDSKVREMLTQLDNLTVSQFVADVAADLDKFGLATPTLTVTLRGEGTNTIAQFIVGSPDETGAVRHVKRADEPFVYSVDAHALDALPAGYLALRTRRLSDLQPEQITKLSVVKAGNQIEVKRQADGNWQLVEPPHGVLNVDALKWVLGVFTQLPAREFLAEGLDRVSELGLDSPEITLTAVAGDKSYTLAIAQQQEGKLPHAFWSDPPLIFTLTPPDVAILERELVTTAPEAKSPATPAAPAAEVVTPPVAAPVPAETAP